jgi:(E)-4-hydroxy-3-methylbut-2-enyl-diphosphate synthase
MGIGTLLEDGLGDTIRVSLTEEPENEIPVARKLVKKYTLDFSDQPLPEISDWKVNPYEYQRRKTKAVLNIGGENPPVVMADFSLKSKITPQSFFALGYRYNVKDDKWNITDNACDYIFAGNTPVDFEIPGTLGIVYHYNLWLEQQKPQTYPFIQPEDFVKATEFSPSLNFIYACYSDLNNTFLQKLKNTPTAVLVIDSYHPRAMHEQRLIFQKMMENNIETPVIIGRAYKDIDLEQLQLDASRDFGALLLDGLGDGIFIAAENCGSDMDVNSLAFGILQASRTRISKTEYISCPSCGRTLFDLQETTAKIRSVTNHLKGVKIGIMGCIVNGPGEMADADYGYVGTGPGKITLYKQKEVVKRNVPEEKAVEELISLIKAHGDWIEPPV